MDNVNINWQHRVRDEVSIMECRVLVLRIKYVAQNNVITVSLSLHVIIPLTQDGSTPLNVASQNGHSDVVKILIRNGADVNLANNVWRYNAS